MDKKMMAALEADGEKLRQLTGEDHGPHFVAGSAAPDALVLKQAHEQIAWDTEEQHLGTTFAKALVASAAREAKFLEALESMMNDAASVANASVALRHDVERHVEIAADLATREAKLREAGQEALTALCYHVGGNLSLASAKSAIKSLREAMAGGSDGE